MIDCHRPFSQVRGAVVQRDSLRRPFLRLLFLVASIMIRHCLMAAASVTRVVPCGVGRVEYKTSQDLSITQDAQFVIANCDNPSSSGTQLVITMDTTVVTNLSVIVYNSVGTNVFISGTVNVELTGLTVVVMNVSNELGVRAADSVCCFGMVNLQNVNTVRNVSVQLTNVTQTLLSTGDFRSIAVLFQAIRILQHTDVIITNATFVTDTDIVRHLNVTTAQFLNVGVYNVQVSFNTTDVDNVSLTSYQFSKLLENTMTIVSHVIATAISPVSSIRFVKFVNVSAQNATILISDLSAPSGESLTLVGMFTSTLSGSSSSSLIVLTNIHCTASSDATLVSIHGSQMIGEVSFMIANIAMQMIPGNVESLSGIFGFGSSTIHGVKASVQSVTCFESNALVALLRAQISTAYHTPLAVTSSHFTFVDCTQSGLGAGIGIYVSNATVMRDSRFELDSCTVQGNSAIVFFWCYTAANITVLAQRSLFHVLYPLQVFQSVVNGLVLVVANSQFANISTASCALVVLSSTLINSTINVTNASILDAAEAPNVLAVAQSILHGTSIFWEVGMTSIGRLQSMLQCLSSTITSSSTIHLVVSSSLRLQLDAQCVVIIQSTYVQYNSSILITLPASVKIERAQFLMFEILTSSILFNSSIQLGSVAPGGTDIASLNWTTLYVSNAFVSANSTIACRNLRIHFQQLADFTISQMFVTLSTFETGSTLLLIDVAFLFPNASAALGDGRLANMNGVGISTCTIRSGGRVTIQSIRCVAVAGTSCIYSYNVVVTSRSSFDIRDGSMANVSSLPYISAGDPTAGTRFVVWVEYATVELQSRITIEQIGIAGPVAVAAIVRIRSVLLNQSTATISVTSSGADTSNTVALLYPDLVAVWALVRWINGSIVQSAVNVTLNAPRLRLAAAASASNNTSTPGWCCSESVAGLSLVTLPLYQSTIAVQIATAWPDVNVFNNITNISTVLLNGVALTNATVVVQGLNAAAPTPPPPTLDVRAAIVFVTGVVVSAINSGSSAVEWNDVNVTWPLLVLLNSVVNTGGELNIRATRCDVSVFNYPAIEVSETNMLPSTVLAIEVTASTMNGAYSNCVSPLSCNLIGVNRFFGSMTLSPQPQITISTAGCTMSAQSMLTSSSALVGNNTVVAIRAADVPVAVVALQGTHINMIEDSGGLVAAGLLAHVSFDIVFQAILNVSGNSTLLYTDVTGHTNGTGSFDVVVFTPYVAAASLDTFMSESVVGAAPWGGDAALVSSSGMSIITLALDMMTLIGVSSILVTDTTDNDTASRGPRMDVQVYCGWWGRHDFSSPLTALSERRELFRSLTAAAAAVTYHNVSRVDPSVHCVAVGQQQGRWLPSSSITASLSSSAATQTQSTASFSTTSTAQSSTTWSASGDVSLTLTPRRRRPTPSCSVTFASSVTSG